MSLRHPLTVLLVINAMVAVSCEAQGPNGEEGQLSFKAHAPTAAVVRGKMALNLAQERDGFLAVPHDNSASHRQPLLILMHGATQASRLFDRLVPLADTLGVVILAPESRGITWDAIRGEFGPDVEFLDRAIMAAFDRAHIDPCRVVLGGFSDGATYALSLAIRNAHQFSGVVAFSPGFIVPAPEVGKLPVFLRHGTQDQILPIDRASRPILSALRQAGFTVDYQEFDGPHTVRPADARAAMQWASARTCATAR